MCQIGPMNDTDYEVFWDCMKIYESQGVNYFADYLDLRSGRYGDFTAGIECWFNDKSRTGQYPSPETFIHFVQILRFFSVPFYDGISFLDFESKCDEAYELYHRTIANEKKNHGLQKEKAAQKGITDYFNFDWFSENKFKNLIERFTSQEVKDYSINEALLLAQEMPLDTYIVVLKKNGKTCHIGKTGRPLSYIGMHYKTHNADTAFFDAVDIDYIDDLILAVKIIFKIPLASVHILATNRKYTTMDKAVSAYKQSKSISRKETINAIISSNTWRMNLENGNWLIDKIALHKVLKEKFFSEST